MPFAQSTVYEFFEILYLCIPNNHTNHVKEKEGFVLFLLFQPTFLIYIQFQKQMSIRPGYRFADWYISANPEGYLQSVRTTNILHSPISGGSDRETIDLYTVNEEYDRMMSLRLWPEQKSMACKSKLHWH
jgi:hypothetical protein